MSDERRENGLGFVAFLTREDHVYRLLGRVRHLLGLPDRGFSLEGPAGGYHYRERRRRSDEMHADTVV
jgi:hypothetical protein